MRMFLLCAVLLSAGCHKSTDTFLDTSPVADTTGFTKYVIQQGAHYASDNTYKPIETSELKFTARFDNSAMYQSATAENQYDINKLYGFSDNGAAHHEYSARFGWRWSAGALRLFAYVYNGGKVVSEELGPVPIGKNITCRIKVESRQYVFYCNEYVRTMPRQSKTGNGKGYLLYPYFGGDEAAPHEVDIWIRND
jgi:hypothetical protein